MQDREGGGMPPSRVGILDQAVRVFERAATEVALAIERLSRDEAGGAARTVEAVRELQAALAVLMDERVKIDRLRSEVAGVVGARALDLDAARDEIGRRLARLRGTGGGD